MKINKNALKESIINTLVGYLISLLSVYLVFPITGIESSHKQNFLVVLYFTILSILRNYIIRNFFNKLNSKQNEINKSN